MKKHRQLGGVLVEAGVITEAALEQASVYQQNNDGIALAQALVATGALTGREIAAALSIELELPFLTLENIAPPAELLARIPPHVARSYGLVPVLKIRNELVVAVSDPLEPQLSDSLAAYVELPVHFAVAPAEQISEALDTCYPAQSEKGRQKSQEKPGWVWPEKKPGSRSGQTSPGSLYDAWGKKARAPETGPASNPRKGGTDIFARPGRESSYKRGGLNLFGTGAEKNSRHDPKKPTGFEGVLAGTADSAPSRQKEADSGADEGGHAPAVSANPQAIEHFEKGLAALRNDSYEEALQEFEAALAHDPQNRVCKANIQRIRSFLYDEDE